jgi:antitoxin (DNA-binding transcriptional repressor) of toxin-antitoxin stability system
MYNAKRYTASQLRQHLAGALDEVERGEPVVVERRGRRFRIIPDVPSPAPRTVAPFFQLTDRTLLDEGWTWRWTGPGRPLRLTRRRRRRRSRS